MEEVKILLTPTRCKIINKKQQPESSSSVEQLPEKWVHLSFFPLCYHVFKPPFSPNRPRLSHIMSVLSDSHTLHFTSLIYYRVFIAVVHVLILLCKMGRCATFVPCSHFVHFFLTVNQIKVIFFCSKEKHMQYIELIYEYVFMCMLSVISLIQLSFQLLASRGSITWTVMIL